MKKAAFAAVLISSFVAICSQRGSIHAAAFGPTVQSAASASSLQTKIDKIKKTQNDKTHQTERLDVNEKELESYVMISMKKDIPVKVESIRVLLTPGTIAADSRLTLPPDATGNYIVDLLVSGTHSILIKGKIRGSKGVGKFDLQDVRVDGLPVPNIVIDALIKHYVKPKYPNVDLKEPFDLPWGIDEIAVNTGKATITY
jgi:hypothetical protein